jgi:peptidoglycan/xylan/chitin deacetylase (PgdA/CDA1 family)
VAGLSAKRLSIGALVALALVVGYLDLAHAVKREPLHSRRASHAAAAASRPATGCTERGPEVVAHGPSGGHRLALTFDDGPRRWTAPILRELNDTHARATFFEEGRHVPGNQSVMREILHSGDEIGNHSTWHHAFPGPADLARTDRLIYGATGFEPCLFRPPYGLLTHHVIAGAARDGLQTILWSVDSLDDKEPGVRAIDREVIDHAHAGAIVLMHDGGANRRQTVAAVPQVVRGLRERGYRLVTVAGLLGERMRRDRQRRRGGAGARFRRISPRMYRPLA